MLSKIIIKGFRSFKNETKIDFTRTNYTFLSDTNVADNDILKGIMFVGANASGKSNIILAIKLLLDLLFVERDVVTEMLLCLFGEKQEFSIDYYFKIEGKQISYKITNDVLNNILYEKLYIDENLILERMGLTAKSYIVDNKETIYTENELNKDTLALRTIYFNTRFAGNETLIKWFKFLQNSIYFNAFDKRIIQYGKEKMVLDNYLQKYGTEKLNEFFTKYNFGHVVDYVSECRGDHYILKTEDDDEKALFFRRTGINMPLPFGEESLGNRTLLNMLPSFLKVLENKGMLLIDEFSSGFHNELEELLIKYFMKNSVQSQMIFVSHSTNILSTAILRPDQIYSVNFDGINGSRIKRFSDEQPRVAQNLEKMYVSGVFEGLPNYKEDNES